MKINRLYVPREIGVCGSSNDLDEDGVKFCEALGRRLALDRSVVIVSSGTMQHKNPKDNDFAAEWHIVKTAVEVLEANKIDSVFDRIVTIPRRDESEGGVP